MSFSINWNVNAGDPVLTSPQYQKWSQYQMVELTSVEKLGEIKEALGNARASRESAAVINYLSWLVRSINLIAPPTP